MCYLLFPVQSHHVGDQIVVYADVVAPKNAPVESYWISHLPFCMHPLMQAQTMYQALTGHKKIDVGIHLTFGKDMDNVELCEIVVNETGFVMFRGAIERDFAILLWLGDEPAWAPLGSLSHTVPMIYTKWEIEVRYAGDAIVGWDIRGDNAIVLATRSVKFAYRVTWKHVDGGGERELASGLYVGVLLSVLLTSVLVLQLRLRKKGNDASYNDDDFQFDTRVDSGWSALHGDVFRAPPRVHMLSTFSGTGMQLAAATVLFAALVSLFGVSNSDSSFRTGVIVFIICAPLGGLWSVALGRLYSYPKWLEIAWTSVTILPSVIEAVYLIASIAGWFYGTSKSFRLVPVAFLTLLQLFFVLPLAAVGGVFAAHAPAFQEQRCKVAYIPRRIPKTPWYASPQALSLAVGFTCWLSIATESHTILSAFWLSAPRSTSLLSSVVIFMYVSSTASILATFTLLNHEVHEWQWISFTAPFTTSAFTFLQVVYFFASETQLTGFYQTTLYYLYMGAFCLATGFMASGVGTCASTLFVQKLYATLKTE